MTLFLAAPTTPVEHRTAAAPPQLGMPPPRVWQQLGPATRVQLVQLLAEVIDRIHRPDSVEGVMDLRTGGATR